mmetsp:Transcript_63356/g.150154  ORF Transcript_63356/g.150154 Transcript_63356/m.150154 type:complete len:88 (-) Transcript_63356:771-1034(-)
MSTSLDHAMLASRLEAFSNACNRASAAFNELAIKFPSSPALLRAHAQFIEDVMSDTSRAKDMRVSRNHGVMRRALTHCRFERTTWRT